LVKLSSKAKQEEIKDRFILAAFVGWQMGAGGNKVTFGTYLTRLGISSEPPQRVDSQDKEVEAKKLSRMGVKARKIKK